MTEDDKVGVSFNLATSVDYHIRLSPTMSATRPGRPVVAFLIRLEPGNANVNTTQALRPFPLKSKVVDSCVKDTGVGSLSHIIHYDSNGPVANNDPGEIGLVKMDMADTNVVLTVTVVDTEYGYYASSYSLNFVPAPTGFLSFGSGRAPTMSPTSSPQVPSIPTTTTTMQPVANTLVGEENTPAAPAPKVKTTTVPDSTSSADNTRVRTIVSATALSLVGFGVIAIFVFCSYKRKRIGDNAAAPAASGNVGHELV